MIIFGHSRIHWRRGFASSCETFFTNWFYSFIINEIALLDRFFYFCHLAFNQIICEPGIMSTFIIKDFSFLFLSSWNWVFEEVIFEIRWEVNLRIFLLISFCIKISHQSINICIYLICLSSYTGRIEDRHFILVIFILILNSWTIRLLDTLISKNPIELYALYFVNISQ